MKKRALTLLEVMIALILASILLTTLFGFYKQLFVTRATIQKNKEIVFQRLIMQEKLTQIFGKVVPEIEKSQKSANELVFYTADEPATLHFIYDNGIDPDPSYCGPVKAKLYLSKDKKLTLHTWPGREEILLENINSLYFSFFDMKKKIWKKEWLGEKEELPVMLKLSIKMENEDVFVFFLPGSYKKITYKK